jgi:hypothetical protein
MKRIIMLAAVVALFACANTYAVAAEHDEEDIIEMYIHDHGLFKETSESLQNKFIKITEMFEEKNQMYNLMTFDGIAYLQLKSELLQMLIVSETMRDLATLGATSHYEKQFTGNIDSFYEHFARTKALLVFNGANATLQHLISIAKDDSLILLIRDVLQEDVNVNRLRLKILSQEAP